MFKVNRAVEYALVLLINLDSGEDNIRPLTDIAGQNHLPLKYLEKIAKKLKKSKIISSKEGLGGGYFLAMPKSKISIKKVIHAVQGKKGLVSCIHGQCSRETECLHKNVWFKLQNKLERELEKIKLAELVK